MDDVIRAAGGVLYRNGERGVEIAVVHRPRHDDWSLPKGKRKRGEHPAVNAHREVWEETAVRPRLSARLPTVAYEVPMPDGSLHDKTVDYWAMTGEHDDGFAPGDETDQLAWLTVDPALARLSYERDVLVVKAFAARPALVAPILVLRHASAGDRHEWKGPDDQRPLDHDGAARADLLAAVLPCFGVHRLISAAPKRCRDTLGPTAAAVGGSITVDDAFADRADPAAAIDRLRALARAVEPGATVICSQGKLIPALLAGLAGDPAREFATPKGGGWVLGFTRQAELAALDPLD